LDDFGDEVGCVGEACGGGEGEEEVG
jgi:hypothetical protein